MPADHMTQKVPRSLLWSTDFEVLPLDRVVERREGYLVVRSPSNPSHFWGNLLLFDEPPAAGDATRWERLFDAELGGDPRVEHQTFAWDQVDGVLGLAREEFVSRGYSLQEIVGLVGTPERIRAHPRENRDVSVCELEPAPGVDAKLWEQVVELQVDARDPRHDETSYREYARRRLEDLRALFRAGRGAWYVALDACGGAVLGSCGVVATGTSGRFQSVDTASAHRRRGICSRLVVEAAHRAAERYGARQFVIGAEPDYHALGLYESLGFRRTERVCGVSRWPPPGTTGQD